MTQYEWLVMDIVVRKIKMSATDVKVTVKRWKWQILQWKNLKISAAAITLVVTGDSDHYYSDRGHYSMWLIINIIVTVKESYMKVLTAKKYVSARCDSDK